MGDRAKVAPGSRLPGLVVIAMNLELARFIAFIATMKNVSGQVFQLDSRIGPWT